MSENEKVESAGGESRGKVDVFADYAPEIKVRTKKMLMWFIIFAVVMLFAGITSALIVLWGKLYWLHVTPPPVLWASIVLVALSSVTMVIGVRSVKRGNQQMGLIMTALTFLLGLAFVFTQNSGWNALSERGIGSTTTLNAQGLEATRWNPLGKVRGEYGKDYYITLKGELLEMVNGEYYLASDTSRSNPRTADVMSTFNAAGALLAVLIYVHILHLMFGLIYLVVNSVRIARNRINRENWISLYTGGMYWHFMGFLWIYLFFFMFFIY
ncbi:MAG: heme-copper oxidase subunit III [Flavobacteriales bacterium]|jgi:cytochrome c oxidase subunit 3